MKNMFLMGLNSPMIETKLELYNEADNDVAELYLYGPIRPKQPWDDEKTQVITSADVLEKLKDLGSKRLDVHVNSKGGEVYESLAISNILRNYKGEVHAYVDGLAGSGASLILDGADKIFMFKNSSQMIHKAWTYTFGNADQLRKVAEDLDVIDETIKKNYVDRFNGTTEELDELLKSETWLTADKCKKLGLCDEIVGNISNLKKDVDVKAEIKQEDQIKENEENDVEPKNTLFSNFKK